jgi:hypothetical protein
VSTLVEESEEALPGYLDEARRILHEAAADPRPAVPDPDLPLSFERIRWFPLGSEVVTAPLA